MSAPAVEFNNVTKTFGEHVAVRDLSLTVPHGTIYGLLGPNGAGKTTTIRMLLNIIAPDTGAIRVLGEASTTPGLTDRIGYLPEERGLYRKMKVRRVLRFLAELKGVPRRTADARVVEWLTRLGLRTPEQDWGAARVDDLSRGMQQKVQFIAALLHDPELIILDEPFSGLDPLNAQLLKDIVMDLRRAGKTIIFSTHMMDNAERMCDAVCIIAGGRKILDGELADIKAERGGRHVALTLDGGATNGVGAVLEDASLVRRVDESNRSLEVELAAGADPSELLRRLVAADATINRFELVQPSLHRIFVEQVGAQHVEEGITGNG